MSQTEQERSSDSINWTAVMALYAALTAGLVWMLVSGAYRNATWLVLIGLGGGFTAYGRVLERRGREAQAQRWQWAAGLAYAIFFLWTGTVFIQAWTAL